MTKSPGLTQAIFLNTGIRSLAGKMKVLPHGYAFSSITEGIADNHERSSSHDWLLSILTPCIAHWGGKAWDSVRRNERDS